MTFHKEIEALRAEIRDIRNDAVGPVEKLADELTALRHRQDRHKELLVRWFRHFSALHEKLEKEIHQMALNVTTLQSNLAALKTDVDALIASHGTTEAQAQAVIDDAANQVAAVDATVKAATPAATQP